MSHRAHRTASRTLAPGLSLVILIASTSAQGQGPAALVRNINLTSSNPGSSPQGFAVLGSNAFFAATREGLGTELWKTNGMGAGTVLVSDINPVGDSAPDFLSPGAGVPFPP